MSSSSSSLIARGGLPERSPPESGIGTGRILAYGALGLPLAFAALPIYVHMPRFYAQATGMELAVLGATLLGARLFDAVIDPWLGWLADRVSRRRMVVLALVPFTAGFGALLHPPPVGTTFWLLASLVVTYVGFSAASVAYQAWGAAVGTDSRMRTRLTAAREGFGLVGVVVAAALPALLASELNSGIAQLAWVLPALLLPAAVLLLTFVDAERSAPPARRSVVASLRRALTDLSFRRLLLVFVANGISAALPATLFLFFVADVLQQEAASGLLLALYFVAGAASMPGWVWLAARAGRVRTWLAAMGLSVIAFAGAGLLGSGDLTLFASICVASGFALGADLALPAAMAADLGERQGQPGTHFGVWNFVAKLNLALAAGLSLPLLAWLGYEPGSGDSLPALRMAYALLPVSFKVLAGALLWRWRRDLESRT
jgi:Na+/melibiose symporter-like transporter